MRILLTGSTGFIGSHLLPKLLESKHDVAVLVRQRSKVTPNECVIFEGCDTFKDVDLAITQFKPELVIHLAALYINNHNENDLNSLISSNITFGSYVLEAMKKNSIGKIVNIGTRWQHMNDNEFSPANLYAATKEAFQDILIYYTTLGIRYKTLELCDTFGKNDTRMKIIDLLFEACLSRKKLDLSPGEQILDVVNVDDVCTYIINNIEDESFFNNQRVGVSGNEISLINLGRLIEEITEKNGYLNFGGKNYRFNEVMKPPRTKNMVYVSKHLLKDDLMRISEYYRNKCYDQREGVLDNYKG